MEQDLEKAYYWYRKAAQRGYDMSMYALALCYENGRGVEQDFEEALKWYKLSAAQGNADATKALERIEKGEVASEGVKTVMENEGSEVIEEDAKSEARNTRD